MRITRVNCALAESLSVLTRVMVRPIFSSSDGGDGAAEMEGKMARVIYKCSSKSCGNIWAVDYKERAKVSRGYGKTETTYWRIDRKLGRVNAWTDVICPECGERCGKAGMVKGSKAECPCDARCTEAKGFVCNCSCGGANHGGGYLTYATEAECAF